MKIGIVVLSVLLAGCVAQGVRELNDWVAQNKPRAESGAIKWSEYYKEFYGKTVAAPNFNGKGRLMESTNFLIQAAKSYEAGSITKERFDYFRRSAQAEMQKQDEAQQAAKWRALQEAGAAMQNSGAATQRNVPSTTNCQTFRGTLNCTTQ